MLTGRVVAVASVTLALLLPQPGAWAGEALTSPDVEIGEEAPVVLSATTSAATFTISPSIGADPTAAGSASQPSTCKMSVSNVFQGTRDSATKKVTGTFTLSARTTCGGIVEGLYVIVREDKTVSVTTTTVKTAAPAACQVGVTPCTDVESRTTYNCSPCNPASWRARSTHRFTLPVNSFVVDPPAGCTMVSPGTYECRLESSRTTIK